MQPHAPGRQLVPELCEESETNHLDPSLPTEIVVLKGSWGRNDPFSGTERYTEVISVRNY